MFIKLIKSVIRSNLLLWQPVSQLVYNMYVDLSCRFSLRISRRQSAAEILQLCYLISEYKMYGGSFNHPMFGQAIKMMATITSTEALNWKVFWTEG